MTFGQYATCFILFGPFGTLLLLFDSPNPAPTAVVFPSLPYHPLIPDLASEYRDQLFDDHHVADLCGREHDELFQPDVYNPFYNLTTAFALMVGRFGLAIPALALAALFGCQRNAPATLGTLPTHSFVFASLLTACLIVMVAVSYLSFLALGLILERLRFGAWTSTSLVREICFDDGRGVKRLVELVLLQQSFRWLCRPSAISPARITKQRAERVGTPLFKRRFPALSGSK